MYLSNFFISSDDRSSDVRGDRSIKVLTRNQGELYELQITRTLTTNH